MQVSYGEVLGRGGIEGIGGGLNFFIYTLRVRVGYILIGTLLIICNIVFMYLGMTAAQTAG